MSTVIRSQLLLVNPSNYPAKNIVKQTYLNGDHGNIQTYMWVFDIHPLKITMEIYRIQVKMFHQKSSVEDVFVPDWPKTGLG